MRAGKSVCHAIGNSSPSMSEIRLKLRLPPECKQLKIFPLLTSFIQEQQPGTQRQRSDRCGRYPSQVHVFCDSSPIGNPRFERMPPPHTGHSVRYALCVSGCCSCRLFFGENHRHYPYYKKQYWSRFAEFCFLLQCKVTNLRAQFIWLPPLMINES